MTGAGAVLEFVNGDLNVSGPIVLKSPNGTQWAVTVDDSGRLTTTKRP